MREPMHQRGFTMIEVMIVIAISAVLSLAGGMVLTEWTQSQRVKGTARNMADLALLARGEAIRTGTPHLLFFSIDNNAVALQTPDGTAAAALVAVDDDGDGFYDAPDEFVSASPLDTTGTLSWGLDQRHGPRPRRPDPGSGQPAALVVDLHDSGGCRHAVGRVHARRDAPRLHDRPVHAGQHRHRRRRRVRDQRQPRLRGGPHVARQHPRPRLGRRNVGMETLMDMTTATATGRKIRIGNQAASVGRSRLSPPSD